MKINLLKSIFLLIVNRVGEVATLYCTIDNKKVNICYFTLLQ